MITLPIIKRLIPEIDAYIKEGHEVVMEVSDDGKSRLGVERYYDIKSQCPYYIVQLSMQDRKGEESYFVNAKIYCKKKAPERYLTTYGGILETSVSYEIERADNAVRFVQTKIQTIDENKCLVERIIQKANHSDRIETANIAERVVFEERNADGVLSDVVMYPGDVLVPYGSLVGSRKWAEYKNNPKYPNKVKNFRYIPIKTGTEAGGW